MFFPDFIVNDIYLINNYRGVKENFHSIERTTHMFSYQLSGSYEHTFPDKKVTFKKDTVFFMNADLPYQVKTLEIGNSVSFHFRCTKPVDIDVLAFECRDPKIRSLFEKAYIDWNRFDNQHQTTALYNFYNLLLKTNAHLQKIYTSPKQRLLMQEISSYIHQHVDRSISVTELSAVAGISERRLRTIFQQEYHTSPSEYILSVRMNTACNYIKSGLYSAREISEMVGFEDVYYFNKCFKKHIGVSIDTYRKRIKY